MKLHLPCALRGVLLATFALACTLPTWAGWSGDSFLMTAEDVAASTEGTLTITTAENAPGANGWFLRSYHNQDEAPVDGALTATINSLNLTKHDSGTPTLNIAGHWSADKSATHSFTNLTINTLNVSTDFAGDSRATIKVAANNTLSVNSVTGGATAFTLEDNATLHLNFWDFAGTKQTDANGDQTFRNDAYNRPTALYTGGLAGNITGTGTSKLVLHGEIIWERVVNNSADGVLWSAQSYTSDLTFNFTGAIDVSNLKLTMPDGYVGFLTVANNTLVITSVRADTERYSVPVDSDPTKSYTSTSFTSTSLGQLEGPSTNATKTWTIKLTGTLTDPGAGNTKDVILLSTKNITADSGNGTHGAGNFCLYLTPTGQLVMHNKANGDVATEGYSSWTLSEAMDNGGKWTSGSYDITLSYGAIGSGAWGFTIKGGSSLTLDGNAVTLPAYDRTIVDGGARPNADALNNLYTRLPDGTTSTVTVTGGDAVGGVYWLIISNVSVDALLSGKLLDSTTRQGVAMESTDALRFDGGGLRSGSETTRVVTLNNPIEAVADAFVHLMPAAGTTLILTKGNGALTSGQGLVVEGGKGSTVELLGVTKSDPQNITLSADTTLAISGPGTLTIDAALNSFDSTSSLSKNDGGSFIYIAKPDDSINSLSNSKGELEIQGSAAASTLKANSLKLVEGGAQATANTVSAATVTLGHPNSWNGTFDNALTVGTLTASQRIDMAAGTHISANSLKTDGLMLIGGSRIDVGNGRLEITGANNSADLGGILASNSISVTGHNGYANLKGVVLTGNSLAAANLKDALITVGPQRAPKSTTASTTLLELANANNSLIRVEKDTLIRNSNLVGSQVEHINGALTMQGGSLNATSSITSTAPGGRVTLDKVAFAAGSSIISNGTTYQVVAGSPVLTLSGNVSGANMALSHILIDVTGDTTETTNTLLLDSGDGKVNLVNCTTTLYTAPGMRGSLQTDANGNLVYTVWEDAEGIMREVTNTTNSQAAAPALVAGAAASGGVLEALHNFVLDTSHYSLAERRAAMHQLTSGSITMLADSQRRNVTNTVNSLRNRVVQMGNPQGIEPEVNVHAWIAAEGNNNDIDQDGDYAGYEYQTWGGSVGAHADIGNYSFGAALNAAYGELTAHSSDRAEGDHNSVALSGFARHQSGRWMQMGILSLGRNELELERYVKDYNAKGDTSGYTATAYYEAGYTFSLNEDSTQVIQPIVSLMVTGARMDGLTESGSIGNAGLSTGTEDYFYGTVGLGARYQIVLAEDVNERFCFLELRAKVVQDFGDETNEATVRFSGAPGSSFVLQGADVGRTGFQFGAGISIPTGIYTTIFADVDADIRSGATSVSGNVGLRVEF